MLNIIDVKLLYLINKGCMNPVFDRLMPILTSLGSGGALFLMAIILLFFNFRSSKKAGLLILAGLTVSYNLNFVLKDWIARPRPFLALQNVHTMVSAKGFSFPSYHATAIFMAAVILAACFGRRWLFFAIAALVALSRVYLGVHYPSDVIAGAVFGSLIGYGLVRISKDSA